mgnify:CR=1 FL=1
MGTGNHKINIDWKSIQNHHKTNNIGGLQKQKQITLDQNSLSPTSILDIDMTINLSKIERDALKDYVKLFEELLRNFLVLALKISCKYT